MVRLDGYFKVKPQYFESNRLLVPFKMEEWNESLKIKKKKYGFQMKTSNMQGEKKKRGSIPDKQADVG